MTKGTDSGKDSTGGGASIPTLKGGKLGSSRLEAGFLAGAHRPAVLREAVLMYEANLRVGTASVKGRGDIAGSTKKMYKQKHTGRARHGDRKAPSFRKGAVAHGPHPRDYRYALPRRALRQALLVALAGKLQGGQIKAWAGTPVVKASTKAVVAALEALGIEGGALLVGAAALDANLLLSVRNLQRVKALPAAEVTAHDIVSHRTVVLLDGAFEVLRERLADTVTSRTAVTRGAQEAARDASEGKVS